MKTIQCADPSLSSPPPQWRCGDIPAMGGQWRRMVVGRYYIYYALCFVLVEHSVRHEPNSVLINVYIYA